MPVINSGNERIRLFKFSFLNQSLQSVVLPGCVLGILSIYNGAGRAHSLPCKR